MFSTVPCSFLSDQETSMAIVRHVIAETEIPGSEGPQGELESERI